MKYLQRILKRLVIVLQSKWILGFPNRNKIVVFGHESADKLRAILLGHAGYTILPDNREIYIPIVFISILYLRYGRWAYCVAFLKTVGAQYFLNFHDDAMGLSVPARAAGCKSFFFQNGVRDDKCFPISNMAWDVDYYFVFGECWARYVERLVNGKVIAAGSLINNMYCEAKFERVSRVQWVSHFTEGRRVPKGRDNVTWEQDVFATNKICLEVLKEFCDRRGLCLEVLLRDPDSNAEREFYKSMGVYVFPGDKTDKPKWQHSYINAAYDAIIVNTSGTLGYELFSRNYRVAFFGIRSKLIGEHSLRFAWPKITADNGPFWCNTIDTRHMYHVLEFLYQVTENSWRGYVKQYEDVICYNHANRIIKSQLMQENVPHSSNSF